MTQLKNIFMGVVMATLGCYACPMLIMWCESWMVRPDWMSREASQFFVAATFTLSSVLCFCGFIFFVAINPDWPALRPARTSRFLRLARATLRIANRMRWI